jgi:FPC/CPF motif-containing protein YcgG
MSTQRTKSIHRTQIIEEYRRFLRSREFPCIGAKAALSRDHVKCMVASDMNSSGNDEQILTFIYQFVDSYRSSNESFHSAAVIFSNPKSASESEFEDMFWSRLNSLAELDRIKYTHDKRVSPDPISPLFSFSLKEEAFFIIGLHPASSREARRFAYPAIVFNPHEEFERLKRTGRYEPMKKVVRRRDVAYSGSVNPMLKDFGEAPEVFQYSGKQYDSTWKCPLHHKRLPI